MLNGLFTNWGTLVSIYDFVNRTDATCGAGNVHAFRNTWFHSLWGFHQFIKYVLQTLSVFVNLCSTFYVYGLMTGSFVWMYLTALSRTYFIEGISKNETVGSCFYDN